MANDTALAEVQALLDSLPTPADADAALVAGYRPDPDCECEAKCRWCALLGCETCCNGYMNGDHGVREVPHVG